MSEDYAWKDATFCLTIDDVARALESSPQTVIDLMLTGQIGFYMKADPERRDGLPVDCARFDPKDVTEFLERDHSRYASISLSVLTNLRHYLRTVPRTRDYDTAMTMNRPIQTRSGLHVRLDAVVDHARTSGGSPAATMKGSTEKAFELMGFKRVRSLTPYGDRQRWNVWYRLPEVIVCEGRAVTIDSFLRYEGTIAADEQQITAEDGGPVVAQPIGGDPW